MTIIKARYADGVLTPIEPLDLADGCEVTVSIKDVDEGPRSLGAAIVVDLALAAHAAEPPEIAELEAGLPTDLARNKKHYLYGHPKEEDEGRRGAQEPKP